jgi:hypothetical protein
MGKHKAPFLNNEVISLVENNKTPEQQLWIAVLAKAFDDAFKSNDDRAALDALRWIRHGQDFHYVCHLAGRSGDYVKARMLDRVIEREAGILTRHQHIKSAVNNVIKLKIKNKQKEILEPKKKRKNWKNVADFNWLPRYGHDYVDR